VGRMVSCACLASCRVGITPPLQTLHRQLHARDERRVAHLRTWATCAPRPGASQSRFVLCALAFRKWPFQERMGWGEFAEFRRRESTGLLVMQ
jgi:hypothetical protein